MIAFVIAMPSEADCVIRHLADAVEETRFGRRIVRGNLNGRAVAVVIAGVGKSNAAAATQLALSCFTPDEIVNVGLCGGFGSAMQVGEIYAVKDAVEYDFDLAAVNGTAPGVLNERTTPYLPFVTRGDRPARTLATGDRFNDREDDLALLARLGAELRDMEGAAIAHVCETAGVPCRAYKCLSDVHGHGSMVGQYHANTPRALAALTTFLSTF